MKKTKNYLGLALFIPFMFALVGSGAFSGCNDKETETPVKYAPLRDYQIEVTQDSIYVFDGDRKVGAVAFGNTPIDSLIMMDNQ